MEKTLNPTLSVVVGVYNAEKYLDECMQSLFGQSYKDFEIILVESESTDNSNALCRDYAEKYPDIKFVTCKNSGDTANPRNTGLQYVKGKYVTFIDGDDLVDKDMYATMVEEMEQNNLDAVYCTCHRFFNDDLSTKSMRNIKEVFCQTRQEIVERMIYPLINDLNTGFEVTGSMCMTVYRTDIIKNNDMRVRYKVEIFSDDNFFNIDYLSHCTRAKSINKPFYLYRKNMTSISNTVQDYTIPALLRFTEQTAEIAEREGFSVEETVKRGKIKFIVSYSAVLKRIIDGGSLKDMKDFIRKSERENDIDLSFTKTELGYVELQVKLFWVLMRYRLYAPLYLLVKLYSKLVSR